MAYPVTVPPFEIRRGDPFARQLALTQPVDGVDTPVGLLAFGTDFNAQLRFTKDSATAIDFAVDISMIADPDDPHLTISLTKEQTTALTQVEYEWDVQAVDTSFLTVFEGVAMVTKDVTR